MSSLKSISFVPFLSAQDSVVTELIAYDESIALAVHMYALRHHLPDPKGLNRLRKAIKSEMQNLTGSIQFDESRMNSVKDIGMKMWNAQKQIIEELRNIGNRDGIQLQMLLDAHYYLKRFLNGIGYTDLIDLEAKEYPLEHIEYSTKGLHPFQQTAGNFIFEMRKLMYDMYLCIAKVVIKRRAST